MEQYSVIDFGCTAASGVTPLLHRQVEQVAGLCQHSQTPQKHTLAPYAGIEGPCVEMQMCFLGCGARQEGVEEEEV